MNFETKIQVPDNSIRKLCFAPNGRPSMPSAKKSHRNDSHLTIAVRDFTWYALFKLIIEYFIAAALLLMVGPLILVAALIVKRTSPGPAIYRQTRLGRHGRSYTIYKIRTMFIDSEQKTGPLWATPDDPRVTPVGRFLRRTHLDELPQLWNVLRGEMSLVGPRPERPEFVTKLDQVIPRYRDRMRVRPGLTGLAQVQLPPDTDLESVRRKLACDLYYINQMGPWLDLRILMSTASYLLGIPFHVPRSLLQVPSGDVVEKAYRTLAETEAETGTTTQLQPI
jgi:lipopolysaccharide/colanic/teichoic acid biosynthesis glycosyltransferase